MLSVCLLCLCSHRSCCHPCVIQLLSPVCYLTIYYPKWVHDTSYTGRGAEQTCWLEREQCQFAIGVSAKLEHTKLVREHKVSSREHKVIDWQRRPADWRERAREQCQFDSIAVSVFVWNEEVCLMSIGAVFRDKSEQIRESSLTTLSLTNVSLRFAICNCTIIQLRQNLSQNFNVNFHKKKSTKWI